MMIGRRRELLGLVAVENPWKSLLELIPEEKRDHLFTQCSRRVGADWQQGRGVGGLQAGDWFVTTVKHGPALEALTRRELRLDISEI